jgi:hypothetical protein
MVMGCPWLCTTCANVSRLFGLDYFGHKTLAKTKMQRVIELENNP